jgi:AcrR family transcriptional regulator
MLIQNRFDSAPDDATAVFPGVHLPRQARSRATFEEILEAAESLLREEGLEGLTVQAVLDRTGIGSGSFYARFDSHEALLRFLALRFWGETAAGWSDFLRVDRWTGAPTRDVVSAFVRVLVRWNSRFAPELKAHLGHAMAESEGRLLDEMAEVENTVADYLVDLISARKGSIGAEVAGSTPDEALEDRIRLATLQLFSTLRSRIIFARDETEAGISDATLIRELTRGFLLYIGVAID